MKLETKIKVKKVLLETLKCVLIGLTVGILISLYRYAASFVILGAETLFNTQDYSYLGVGLICVIPIIFIIYYLLISDGSIQGSGIPQLLLNEEHKSGRIKWHSAIPKMFVSSSLSFFLGVPLGSEAPATFMSGNVGLAYRKLFHDDDDEDDVEIASGAGFASVFLSPLAGITYALEEGHTKTTWLKVYKAVITSIVSILISYLINPNRLLSFDMQQGFNWSNSYYLPIILGFCGVIALFMTYGTRFVKQFINKHYKNFFIKYRFIIVALFSLIILIFYVELSGSGHHLINYVMFEDVSINIWWIILIYLIYRLVMFLIAGNSMLSGGNMLPTLAIGAMIGQLIYSMLANIPGFDPSQRTLIILLSMFTLFAFIYKLPITSFVLIISVCEFDGLTTTFIPALILMTLVYSILKIVNVEDVDDILKDLLRTSRK